MSQYRFMFKKIPYKTIISIFLFALILFLFSRMLDNIGTGNQAEQQQILENAVTRSITECYALEGSYPPDITYLTEHYGLTYDESSYFIDYQYIGANLRPDVTILKRNKNL